ncbi:Interleukin-1 receptor-associated kinase 1 [Homalodisca vitripennis]|nr:Interleukin-1 receptor-associated kinase 1 [Homalodisca vitripennis]
MGFDYTYLQYIRRKDSPTDELLTSWGNQNHSVDDLFVLLSKMQHYRAMSLFKDLVQEQYHHLLREGEELMNHHQANKAVDNRPSLRQNSINTPETSQGAARQSRDPVLPQTFEKVSTVSFYCHRSAAIGVPHMCTSHSCSLAIVFLQKNKAKAHCLLLCSSG